MKNINKIFSILIVFALMMCTLIMPSSAAEEATDKSDITILFPDNPSQEFIDRVTAELTGEGGGGYAPRGLTCTLFGHKLETSTIIVITHCARPTEPRCLKGCYDYSVCTRCDYVNAVLISSVYIYCCT